MFYNFPLLSFFAKFEICRAKLAIERRRFKIYQNYYINAVPAEGRKIWGGQHLKTLIGLSVWSTPTILNLGKSGGATAPLAPPVPPALLVIVSIVAVFVNSNNMVITNSPFKLIEYR